MKTHLQERLGVPESIVYSAERYFEDLVEQVRSNIRKSNREEQYYFLITPAVPYRVGDEQIKTVKTTFVVTPKSDIEKIDYVKISTKSFIEPIDTSPGLAKTISNIQSPAITINLVVPSDYVPYDVVNYLINNEPELVASLSHEFKHIYDEHKKGFEKLSTRTQYTSSRDMMDFDIDAFEYLGYYIYYTHLIEALVRPTETLAYLKQNKISKKNFVDFLKKIITYQTLVVINNFSMDKFREELKEKNMDQIENYLKKTKPNLNPNLSEDAKIDLALVDWYEKFVTEDIRKYSVLLANNDFDLLSLPENKRKALQRHVNKLTRFANNPLEYFSYIEEYLRKVSGETLKKIYRLYDLLDDEQTDEYLLQKKISDRRK